MKTKLLIRLVPTAFIAMAFLAQTKIVASASTIFTDRTAFNAATASLQITSNDFDSLVGISLPNNYPSGFGGGFGYETVSPQGITVDHVTFIGIGPFGSETFIIRDDHDGGWYDMDNIITGNFTVLVGRDVGEISFESDVHAFGFDYGHDKGAGSFPYTGGLSATIFFDGGTTSNYVMNNSAGALFFGIYSTASIERILFDNTVRLNNNPNEVSSYLLVDNMTLGSVSAVPEPSCSVASCAMAGFAFAIVGRRRRKL